MKKFKNRTRPANPLDWYTLTETTNSVLHELIAYTGRETVAEQMKEFPDQNRIDALWNYFKEINSINRNVENFKDAGRMEEIIAKYAPVVKKMYTENVYPI